MLFTGEYEHTIDAKQRLAIPARFRSLLDQEGEAPPALYLVPGPNGALWLWPQATFEQMAGAMEQSLLPDEEMMEYEELLFSLAARLEIDSAGRVLLPERLIKLGRLRQSVVVLGVKDHLELRDAAEWAERRRQKLEKQGEIVLRARRALRRTTGAEEQG